MLRLMIQDFHEPNRWADLPRSLDFNTNTNVCNQTYTFPVRALGVHVDLFVDIVGPCFPIFAQ
jgi:hypothetical protein